jgi:hypothetical protein
MGGGIAGYRRLPPMRFARAGRTVESAMLNFREELLRQHKDDLDRRARTAFQLRGSNGSRTVEQRRLRRRALSERWSATLTALHLSPGAKRA